ncbi:MAG TPA: hypothetical protein DCG49_06675 [Ruminococcus sp.]|nr:hypothetical protein [Ruminococcus sp.]
MQIAKTMQFFRRLAGLEHAAPFQDLVDAAVSAVLRELRDGADQNDIRLAYYAAACANLQYRRLIAAQSCSVTYAGSAAAQKTSDTQCAIAESLVRYYREIAADLLRDDRFLFANIPDCCRKCQDGGA